MNKNSLYDLIYYCLLPDIYIYNMWKWWAQKYGRIRSKDWKMKPRQAHSCKCLTMRCHIKQNVFSEVSSCLTGQILSAKRYWVDLHCTFTFTLYSLAVVKSTSFLVNSTVTPGSFKDILLFWVGFWWLIIMK